MSLYSLMGALEIGLIFGLVALGVLITFRVLQFPDLTVDGSFPLGGAVAATYIAFGGNPFIATLLAFFAGWFAGFLTGVFNVKLKIMDLLAGILLMTALYSINLRIMGKPNVPLISEPTIFTYVLPGIFDDYIERPIALLILVLAIKFILDWYFKTGSGLAMRATGANPRMSAAQGIATCRSRIMGVALSNALVALAGALFAQSQGGADIAMGIGTIVTGLAAVIIGESLLPKISMFWMTLGVIIGAILYRFFIAVALNSDFIGLQSQDLNLVAALLVTFVLILPILKNWLLRLFGRRPGRAR